MRRILQIFLSMVTISQLAGPSFGQQVREQLPNVSAFPKSQAECQRYDSELKSLMDRLTEEHQHCLDANASMPVNPGSYSDVQHVCSHSACQSLHDYVYGNFKLEGAAKSKACWASLGQLQQSQQQFTTAVDAAIAALNAPTAAAPLTSQTDLRSYEQQSERSPVIGDNAGTDPSIDVAAANIMSSTASDQRVPAGADLDAAANTSVQSQLDAAADGAIASDQSQAVSDEAKQQAAEFAKSAVDYVKEAAEAWGSIGEPRDLTGSLGLAIDSLKMANIAAGGQVPATIDVIAKLSDYVNSERDALSTLAQRSDNDWLVQSGLNSFDRTTVSSAQAYLDAWSQKLNNIQQAIQAFTPIAQGAENVLENPGVNGIRMALQSTAAGLDPIALNDAIAAMNDCSRQIALILGRIQAARSVTY